MDPWRGLSARHPRRTADVGLNKNGMILLGGMNPIAVAEEAGPVARAFSPRPAPQTCLSGLPISSQR